MSEVADFKPGLEGVVAVETEIAEPDREGGSLRYRGVDIEELVGHVPYENVWGLLVDDDLDVGDARSRSRTSRRASLANAPADLQAETARLAGDWKLGKLNEISDEQAREDLGRLSAQMMTIVARSARVADGRRRLDLRTRWSREGKHRRREVPPPLARRGGSAPRRRRSTRTGSARPSTG